MKSHQIAQAFLEAEEIEMAARIIRHPKLPVSAPETFWRAFGWTVYSNTNTAGERPFHAAADEILAIAITQGLQGEKALAYVATELQRRKEVTDRTEAIRQLGFAIGARPDSE